MNSAGEDRKSGAARVALVCLAVCLVPACVSDQWVGDEVRQRVGPVGEECAVGLKQQITAWRKSHDALVQAVNAHKADIPEVCGRLRRMTTDATGAKAQALSASGQFDRQTAAIATKVTGDYRKADAAGLKRLRQEGRGRTDGLFAGWRAECKAVDGRIQALEARRKKETKWSAIALMPARKGIYDGRPPSVRSFLALDARALGEREAAEAQPERVFLMRSVRNYRAALEALQPDVEGCLPQWRPAWNAEKAILMRSDADTILGQAGRRQALREAVANKAYACDVLIRTRGARRGYDLVEIAYYLNELTWCCEHLGPPFADALKPLVVDYTRRLDERAPMSR